jgi:Leucine-rich repeat (LRR) protein
VTVAVEDLSTKERLQRLGADDSPVAALARGSMAAASQAYAQAGEYFAKLGPPLADPLVALMKEGELKSADESAERVLQRLLKNVQVEVGAFDEAAWTAAVAKFKPDAKTAEATLAALEKFRQKYGESRFARKADGVVRALEFVCQAALPAPSAATEVKPAPVAEGEPRRPRAGPTNDREMQRILMRFAEGNRGIDPENLKWQLDGNGTVRMLQIGCGRLVDLEALRELGTVGELTLQCWDQERSPVSLAPLRDLGIVELHLANLDIRDPETLRALKLNRLVLESCAVRDLGFLAGSAVKDLSLAGTEVKDLAPLKGLALEALNLDNSRVQDVWALSGMPLKSLSLCNTLVRDVGALKGMPLERLALAGTRVFQFQGLRGMALRALDLSDTQFRDLTLCEGMPLDDLRLRNTQIATLAPLAALQLKALDISGTPINDLAPLRNMPLQTLVISNTRLTAEDMTVLKAMPLERLEMAGLPIEDLAFLREKPLVCLNIENTAVRDLWPLAGMRLREFRCRGSKVKGLTVLRDMPITELTMNGDPKEAVSVLRTLPELRRVNGEFWGH